MNKEFENDKLSFAKLFLSYELEGRTKEDMIELLNAFKIAVEEMLKDM